jgi:hypothetical protein
MFKHIKSELSPENVVIAINCGGDEFKDAKGIVYQKDDFYDNGQASDFGTQFEIKLTQDQELYQTERWHSDTFSYKIPFSGIGKHVLVLKFSEVYFNSPNEKVFDIQIGKETVLKHIDIYGKVGKASALDEFIEFEVKDGKVLINGKAAEGAFDDSKKSLNVFFKKAERDNPKINAILIVKGTKGDTDYESFKNQLEDLEKDRLEKEKKTREIQKRSNFHYEFEEFEDDFKDLDSPVKGGRSILNIPIISIIMLAIVGSYFYFKKGQSNEEVAQEVEDDDDKED